jgi:hypothetical protein
VTDINDPHYCHTCGHPHGYHHEGLCSMPVLKGTYIHKGRNDSELACENCPCRQKREAVTTPGGRAEGSEYRYGARGQVQVLRCVCTAQRTCCAHEWQETWRIAQRDRANLLSTLSREITRKRNQASRWTAPVNQPTPPYLPLPRKSDFEEAIYPSAPRSRA